MVVCYLPFNESIANIGFDDRTKVFRVIFLRISIFAFFRKKYLGLEVEVK